MLDEIIKKYGERYRKLIEDAFKFLDEREPKWNLKDPIDRELYIKELIESKK